MSGLESVIGGHAADRERGVMSDSITPALLTINQAAAYLSVSRSTVYGLIAKGLLTSVRIVRGAPRIRRSEIDALIESRLNEK